MWITLEPAAFRKLYLPLGILQEMSERRLSSGKTVEFCDLGKHALSLSTAVGEPSLLLLP